MKNQLTERSQNVIITDVKRNHSIHSEYYEANDPIAGGSGKGDELSLDNILGGGAGNTTGQKTPEDLAEELARKDAELAGANGDDKGGEGDGDSPDNGNENGTDEGEKVVVKLDQEGNQVDDNGTIIKTKADLDKEAADLELQNEVPLIQEVINTAGIQILDENGKPKVYEDTVEGIIKYSNDLAEYKKKKGEEELFNTFPKLKKYLEAQIKGIPDSEYFGTQLTDWKTTTLDEKNENQQFEIVVKELESRGMGKDRAIKMATRIKDSGKDVLLEESKLSLESLQKNQIETEKISKEKYEKELREQEELITNHWKQVETVVTGGKLGDYVIPESDRKAFNEFVSKAVDNEGNSAAMIARNKMSLEQKLIMDYYVFKGGNLDGLAKSAIAKQKVEGLRNRITKANNTTAKVTPAGQGGISISELKLENIKSS